MASIRPSNFFLLRRPTLPINGFPFDDGGLRRYWSDDLVQEAIYAASPSLHEQIHQAIKKNGWPLPKPLQQSLQKYLLRMRTRCTPFGLFAGCSMGEVGDVTEVVFNPTHPFFKYQRLDAAYLGAILQQLNAFPTIREQIRFYPNDSIYVVGGELRYIEHRTVGGQERHYFTSSVRLSTYLESVLELARSGATIRDLTDSLVASCVSTGQASDFISELITQQLLISDLGVAITESAPLTALINRLNQLQGTQAITTCLQDVAKVLAAVHTDGRLVQQQIAQALGQYVDSANQPLLTQTDLFLHTDRNYISDTCTKILSQQLTKLLPLNKRSDTPLITEFANQFRSRYDQQEIPLLQALDNESGIGYGPTRGADADYIPLLDGLTVPPASENQTVNWGGYENLLVDKLSQSLQHRCLSVDITDAELQRITPAVAVQLPANFYVVGNLLASSPNAIDEGHFLFNLLGAQGPSLAKPLGRFCSHSGQLTDNVKSYIRQEEQQKPEAIFAEIVHLPYERLGNVLTHPALYRYEIPVVSHSSVAREFQIGLEDLLLSVGIDNRITLRSKRLQKEVIPRLSTAHNYQNGLPIYQFLCDLQQQHGSLNLYWDWGPLSKQAFLPRITYQNIIVSRARWYIKSCQISGNSAAEFIQYLETHHRLTRWVAIAEGDNELVFNLNAESDQQLFWEEVRKRDECNVVEWLSIPEQCWLRDERGVYTNEVILSGSFETKAPTTSSAPRFMQNEANATARFFSPGSEWLYVKIYTGTRTSHQLLTELIGPLMRKLTSQHKISKWFFVRYADPEPHLRLRCKLTNPKRFASIINRLRKPLDSYRLAGVVHKIQIDTYERELERYGAATMLPSEAIFTADSTAIIQYFELERSADEQWLFALQSIDALLTDFEQDLPARIQLLSGLRDTLLEEHGDAVVFKRQLNDQYRGRQRIIYRELTEASPSDESLRRVLALRSPAIRMAVTAINAHLSSHHQPSLKALLGSYIHMSMNRLFASQQRTQELIIYHHLTRYYESRLARSQAHRTLAEDTIALVEKTGRID